MLGEIADIDLLRAKHMARKRRKFSGDELRERRFAVAVLTQQRDSVVVVDAQIEAAQDGSPGVVAGARRLDPQQRACDHLLRVRKVERHDAIVDLRRDRLHLRQRLDAALRLRRLARLGLEAVDERLQMPALLILLLHQLHFEPLLFAPRFLEVVVAAGVERQLSAYRGAGSNRRRGSADRGRG